MPDSYTTPDELMREIYLAIYAALESRLHLIAGLYPWGFESLILRQETKFSAGEVTELAEGARLLSKCGSKAHPRFESSLTSQFTSANHRDVV